MGDRQSMVSASVLSILCRSAPASLGAERIACNTPIPVPHSNKIDVRYWVNANQSTAEISAT